MNSRITAPVFAILFLLGLVLSSMYGGYFTMPEAALKHISEDPKFSAKVIIDTIYLSGEPVTLYIDAENYVSAAQYTKKIILGKTGFKVVSKKSLNLNTKNIDSNKVIPFKTLTKKGSNIILYGVSKSKDINLIKIDGKSPTLKPFVLDGAEYTLWYIVGESGIGNAEITLD